MTDVPLNLTLITAEVWLMAPVAVPGWAGVPFQPELRELRRLGTAAFVNRCTPPPLDGPRSQPAVTLSAAIIIAAE